MNNSDYLAAFTNIFGSRYVLSGDAVSEKYTVDWMNITRGNALAVVFPENTEQISAFMQYCHQQHIAVVPQGGHTGMSGGATPTSDGREVILSLQRLNSIRTVNSTARYITADAGCLLINLQQAAEEHKLYFPLDLGAKESCQLGGNLATNAGGLNVLRYGNTRDLCLGVEAVLPNGQVLDLLSTLKKDNSGYNLKHLLIGSEGTLAVLTAATMKLFPPAPPILTAWLSVPSVEAALSLLAILQDKTGGAVSAFELLRPPLFSLLQKHCPEVPLPFSPTPLMVLLELSGDGSDEAAMELLADAQTEQMIDDAVIAQSETQRQNFWRVREMTPVAKARHGAWVQADVSLPSEVLAPFIRDMEERLPAICEGMYVGYGHLGDGNLHMGMRPKDENPDKNPQLTEKITAELYDRVIFYGGSFSAEHGIGQAKVAVMEKYKNPTALAMMRQIKQSLDPHNIMNPGRLLRLS